MDPASSERSRFREAMADVPQKPSRGHCGTVPTLTFGVPYCFFVIGHDRRKILHFNVTRNPHALWVVQQLREAWAYQQPHRFLLFDRDASLQPRCFRLCGTWEASQLEQPFAVRGRTVLRNAGWEVADATCWTTKSS
jgi:hypothetical protein